MAIGLAGSRGPDTGARGLTDVSVLAIVVTHDGKRWLRDCLVSLNTQNFELLDVLVVDDASSDSKVQPQIRRIAKRHLKRRRWGYLRTPRPLGFGGAINWALSRVRTDADLLLFIHDDAALSPDGVANMVRRLAADERAAIVGPKIVSWDEPQRLEEVGMLADRFGYPYKGLEEGEIDLGQHDQANDVFYVTSTCMLVVHDVFRQLRGWDARLQAYAEDLDLCWRARLMGYSVRVEPTASARHAIAMATGERESPFVPSRYFIRRNRFRTVFKNASRLRLLALVPQFFLLTLAEMLGFAILRQPSEILNLARAMGWNTLRLPQTLSERARVQRRRTVRDSALRRLTVAQSKRLRFYMSHQRDRLEEAWGRRAEVVALRTSQARMLGGRLRGWAGLVAVLAVLALLLGFRNVWWSPAAAVGEMLPYPERATALLRAFVSPWRSVGLGQPWPNPPALAMLGSFPLLTLGAAGAAQKLLVFTLGVGAFVGGYALVSDLVGRPGRFAAGATYMLGAVGYAGLREGALGALAFGAAAPFVLRSILRLSGWVRPPSWKAGAEIARAALGVAVSGAFVPGALVLYAGASMIAAALRAVVSGPRSPRSVVAPLAAIVLGWVLLLPWSAGWLSDGGPLAILRSEGSWETFAAGFSDHDLLSVLLGQTPDFRVLAGLALPLLGLVALFVGEGQRRRIAFVLWFVIVFVGWVVSLIASGTIRPFLASPTEAGVLASAAFSGLAGIAVGAFRLDLPRRGFGWVHGATLAALAAAIFLATVGVGQAVLRGGWAPGRGSGRENAASVAQIRSLFDAEAGERGPFRALWVGDAWRSPSATAARPLEADFVTGSRGQVLSDLFQRTEGTATRQLQGVVSSVQEGATDRAGALLGAFNIHYVVLDPQDDPRLWLAQRDLALVRSEPDYIVLENDSYLSRAALYSGVPRYVAALESGETVETDERDIEIASLNQHRSNEFVNPDIASPGLVFVAEANHERWIAEFAGERLPRRDGGWGNAFEVPRDRRGRLDVSFPRPLSMIVWLVLGAAMWLVALGAAFPRKGRSARRSK